MRKHDEDDQQTVDELQKYGYDLRDVPVEKTPMHAGALYGFIGLVIGASWLFMSLVDHDLVTVPGAESMERTRSPDVGIPVIQGPFTAKMDIEELRHAEKIGLNTSVWIDEEAGVARIPVEAAIELMLKEGFAPPARELTVPSRPTIAFGSADDEPEAGPGETTGARLVPAEDDE